MSEEKLRIALLCDIEDLHARNIDVLREISVCTLHGAGMKQTEQTNEMRKGLIFLLRLDNIIGWMVAQEIFGSQTTNRTNLGHDGVDRSFL